MSVDSDYGFNIGFRDGDCAIETKRDFIKNELGGIKMGFIKRACLYCYRQRLRTLILFLVLTIIATFILMGIAIRDASVGATADVQTAIGGKIILEPDAEGNSSGQLNQWGGIT